MLYDIIIKYLKIEKAQRPTFVLAHNKTLAGQLYSEFKEFFSENNVEYFVSYCGRSNTGE